MTNVIIWRVSICESEDKHVVCKKKKKNITINKCSLLLRIYFKNKR